MVSEISKCHGPFSDGVQQCRLSHPLIDSLSMTSTKALGDLAARPEKRLVGGPKKVRIPSAARSLPGRCLAIVEQDVWQLWTMLDDGLGGAGGSQFGAVYMHEMSDLVFGTPKNTKITLFWRRAPQLLSFRRKLFLALFWNFCVHNLPAIGK